MYDNGKPIEETRKHFENPKEEGFYKYLTQKNVIIAMIIIFAIWMAFFDRNSLLKRHQLNKEQDKLIEAKQNYQKEIKTINKEIDALDDNEYIEKIAREKHLMKKDNEDIYIITE